MSRPIILAGASRVAALTLACWQGPQPVVFARRGTERSWDMGLPPPPDRWPGSALVSFAGVTPRSDVPLAQNTALALASLRAAREWGIGHVFVLSSSSVYGDTGPDPASEAQSPTPRNAYGAAKAVMEAAVLGAAGSGPGVTILRLANVAGAGQPFDAAARNNGERVPLHRFDDGTGPSRSYIGPVSLARVLERLCRIVTEGVALPPVLNVAAPQPTAMADILRGLGVGFDWVAAPATALARVHLDTRRLNALCPDLAQDGGRAETLISEVDTARRHLHS